MLDKIFSIYEEKIGARKYKKVTIFGIKFSKRISDNNHIYLVNNNGEKKEVKRIKGITIKFFGSNSTIEIGCNPIAKFQDCRILCQNNSFVKIGSSERRIKKLDIRSYAHGSKIVIGNNYSTQSVIIINENEPDLSVTIGDDCMFSSHIYVRPTDAHTIYDIKTEKVLNMPCDIKIGNHVWCGKNTTILKGATIPDGFIIGADSTVTKSSVSPETDYNGGGILAGIPAKVVKTGCTWSHMDTHNFLNKRQQEVVNE